MSKMEHGSQSNYLTAEAETKRVVGLNLAEQQEREDRIAEFLIIDPDYQQAVSAVVGSMVEIGE